MVSASIILWGGSAFAGDGTSGTTSTTTSDIDITIPELVKITGVANLATTYSGGASGVALNDDLCIYSNMDAGGGNDYIVKVTGGDPPGSGAAGFSIGNLANDDNIAISVYWNDATGTTGRQALTHDTNLTTQTGWDTSPSCANMTGANANLSIAITETNLLAVTPGLYENTLTILITPSPG
jgi:hypothetical protein